MRKTNKFKNTWIGKDGYRYKASNVKGKNIVKRMK